MSKIKELKKHNEILDLSMIDLLSLLFEKSKYVDLYLNIHKNNLKNQLNGDERADLEFLNEFFETHNLEKLTKNEKLNEFDKFYLYRLIDYLGAQDIKSIIQFKDLNEQKLILQNDTTKYKNFDEVRNQISIAQLRSLDSELEKQVIKLYDSDEWLLIKPLSWESSKKYGSNTKWCTTSQNENSYFFRYASSGVLVYILNKKTGYKVACYNNVMDGLSFWNQQDFKIDSMMTELPSEILIFIKKHFEEENLKPNLDYLSEEEKLKMSLTEKYFNGDGIRPMIDVEEPMTEAEIPTTVDPNYWRQNITNLERVDINYNVVTMNDTPQRG
jgi:hypothetical protein